MTDVHPQRMAAWIEGDFVVFLIGMRINTGRPLAAANTKRSTAEEPELGEYE